MKADNKGMAYIKFKVRANQTETSCERWKDNSIIEQDKI
jgi:hypothetical protein